MNIDFSNMLMRTLESEPHKLKGDCLIPQFKSLNPKTRPVLVTKAILYRQRDDRKLEEEGLSKAQKSNVKDILDRYLAPNWDPKSRCERFARCITYAPLDAMSKKNKLDISKLRENPDISKT